MEQSMASTDRLKPKLQEDLVGLYLRLNGFFVTSFIVHSSDHGLNLTELDALALRLPFNSEPEREIGPDPLLDLSCQYTDLALCEVKSKGQQLRFNDALLKSPDALKTVLRWAGLFEASEIDDLSNEVYKALSPDNEKASPDMPPTVIGPRGIRVRGLLCSPERDRRDRNQPWFISGRDIMSYVRKCLCPKTPRSSCSTTYDFQSWRYHEPIVRYFKSAEPSNPNQMKSIYRYVEENGNPVH
jgi:hypothetical protein